MHEAIAFGQVLAIQQISLHSIAVLFNLREFSWAESLSTRGVKEEVRTQSVARGYFAPGFRAWHKS